MQQSRKAKHEYEVRVAESKNESSGLDFNSRTKYFQRIQAEQLDMKL